MPPGHFTPPLTQSPLLLHTTTNSSAADAGSPSHDIRGTPMPLPRTATLPQGQPCHTAGRANASPAGQQFQQQQRPTPRPRQNLQTTKDTPPESADGDPEDVYDDIVHSFQPHFSAGVQHNVALPRVAKQPPEVAKKPTRLT
jgi:hypothetical protein